MSTDFEKFANEVKERVFENVGDRDDLKIELHNTQKINGVEQISLAVRHKDSNVAPSVRLSPLFEAYQGGESMESILHSIENSIVSHTPTQSIDIDFVSEFEKVKNMIQPKLINTEKNQQLLSRVPHYDYGDLSLLFYIKLDDNQMGGGQITVDNKIYNSWGVKDSELMTAAYENASKSIKVSSLSAVLEESGIVLPQMEYPLVLTNEDQLYGAVAILNTDVMKGICEEIGGDVVILPSSLHETLVTPEEQASGEDLNALVCQVNDTAVAEEDYLSDHVYYSDGEKIMMLDNDTHEKVPMALISAQTGEEFSFESHSHQAEKISEAEKHQENRGIINITDHKNNKRDDMAL